MNKAQLFEQSEANANARVLSNEVATARIINALGDSLSNIAGMNKLLGKYRGIKESKSKRSADRKSKFQSKMRDRNLKVLANKGQRSDVHKSRSEGSIVDDEPDSNSHIQKTGGKR